jgi:pyruvate/2-oxoglutarate dehydrogenase complex dihydrolipoamide acyltransferase (E2) component
VSKHKNQQEEVIKKSTTPPQERVDAGLVEKDFEQQPNDEVLASGEIHDVEANEAQLAAQRKAGAPEGGVVEAFAPSSQINPYVSEEEQGMEMRPAIVGPPAYGSPRPETSSSKLVPIDQHPLRVDALPEGHPSAISEDFGVGYTGTLSGVDTVTSRPSAPSDLELDAAGLKDQREANEAAKENATDAAVELAEQEGVNLADVKGTGADGRVTKDDVENHLRDQN